MIHFTLDGVVVAAAEGETIWQVAQRQGTDIPHLCYTPAVDYRPDGNCRVCMVEVDGERVLAPSCLREPREGMVVHTESARAIASRKMVLELLLADARAPVEDTKFNVWVSKVGLTASRFPGAARWDADVSHPAMAVNLDACIQCGLCVRACREVQVNDVIGMAYRGDHAKIVFDFDDAMGDSTCVGCGECVQACPTGALLPKTLLTHGKPDRQVDSLCPYCGVGCQLTYHVKDDEILYAEGGSFDATNPGDLPYSQQRNGAPGQGLRSLQEPVRVARQGGAELAEAQELFLVPSYNNFCTFSMIIYASLLIHIRRHQSTMHAAATRKTCW